MCVCFWFLLCLNWITRFTQLRRLRWFWRDSLQKIPQRNSMKTRLDSFWVPSQLSNKTTWNVSPTQLENLVVKKLLNKNSLLQLCWTLGMCGLKQFTSTTLLEKFTSTPCSHGFFHSKSADFRPAVYSPKFWQLFLTNSQRWKSPFWPSTENICKFSFTWYTFINWFLIMVRPSPIL